MNHLESAFTGKNMIWRYVVMIVVILAASNTIGAIPLFIAIAIKSASNPEILTQFSANTNDYSLLGLDPNALLVMMLFPFIAGLGAYLLLIRPLNGRSFVSTISGTGKIRWKRFFISALVWIILSGLYLFVYQKVDPSNFTLNNKSSSLIPLIIISIVMIPFQATFEEVLFRGYLILF
jgi:membrane protease YdiL (CAAX protease family)